jgi:hypothetical protein
MAKSAKFAFSISQLALRHTRTATQRRRLVGYIFVGFYQPLNILLLFPPPRRPVGCCPAKGPSSQTGQKPQGARARCVRDDQMSSHECGGADSFMAPLPTHENQELTSFQPACGKCGGAPACVLPRSGGGSRAKKEAKCWECFDAAITHKFRGGLGKTRAIPRNAR